MIHKICNYIYAIANQEDSRLRWYYYKNIFCKSYHSLQRVSCPIPISYQKRSPKRGKNRYAKSFPFWFVVLLSFWKLMERRKKWGFYRISTNIHQLWNLKQLGLNSPPPPPPPPPFLLYSLLRIFPFYTIFRIPPSSNFGEYLQGLSSHYGHTVRKRSDLIVKKQLYWLPFTYFE